ncbi:MAG: hypothetical protein QXE01_06150 [Sulfolobales archaeon]
MLSRRSLHRILSSWDLMEVVILASIIILTSISSTASIIPNILLITFILSKYISKLDLSPIAYLSSIISSALLDTGSIILIYILGYLFHLLLKYAYIKTSPEMQRYKAINILRTAAIIFAFYPISMYSKIFSNNAPGYDPFLLGALVSLLQVLFVYIILEGGDLTNITRTIMNLYHEIISIAPQITRIISIFISIIGAAIYREPTLLLILIIGIAAEKLILRIDKIAGSTCYRYLSHCITPASMLLYIVYLGL